MSDPIWWLSFAEGKFLGVFITRAKDFDTALRKTFNLGVNPGGQVMAYQCDNTDKIPPDAMDRLLSKEDLDDYPWFEAKRVGDMAEEDRKKLEEEVRKLHD